MITRLERWLTRWVGWLVVGLLLFFWARLQLTAVTQSATFDEIIHILHGALFWQSWQLFGVVQNPPLVNALIGLPVQLALHPAIPFQDPLWQSNDWLRISQQFAWVSNENGLQIIWVGRQAVMLTAVLLGALVYRFAGMLFRSRTAGLLALCLYTFDPNILAHSSLATTDLGAAFFFLLAAYAVWRYWEVGGWKRYMATAVTIGLVLAAKFSGLIFVIALVLIAIYRVVLEIRDWRLEIEGRRQSLIANLQSLLEVIGWIIIGSLIFLFIYRFQLAVLQDDFITQQEHQTTGHDAFFMGEIKRGGWWYYFPVIFLIKTPLPTLALLALALWSFVRRYGWRDWARVWPLLLAGGVMAAGLTSQVNIGYRYLLPMLPLLFVFAGGVGMTGVGARQAGKRISAAARLGARQAGKSIPAETNLYPPASPLQNRSPITDYRLPTTDYRLLFTVYCLLLLLSLTSLAIHPHYLAYFNALVGGPGNGWQWAVDSNLDWGQDLPGLAEYMAENGIDHFYAAWLGSAPLAAYGLAQGEPLRVWPVGREDPMLDTFNPENPAPGVYVFSATQLQGVYARDRARYAWFREREPTARIGYSLFVYDVPASGPTVGLGLSGVGLAHLDPQEHGRTFASNDLQIRWFDGRTSFLWPGGGAESVWTAVGDGHRPIHPLLQGLYPPDGPTFSGERVVDGQTWRYHLYSWPESPIQPEVLAEGTAVFGETLQFLGYEMAGCGEERPLELLTFWQVAQSADHELKLFVHVLDETGNHVAQHDALDVRMVGLQPGDEFAQLHTIALPSGVYTVRLGVYEADTGTRLPLLVGGVSKEFLTFPLVC